MEEAADEAGRAAVPWRNGLNIWCGVGRDAEEARSFVAPAMETFYRLPYESFERYSPAGTPAELTEALLPYAEAGCRIFNLMMVGADVEAEVDGVAEIKARLTAALG
jgi:alkanesulfonate monooxygenase SsuD/methylene tetrahydromethanopterin reductase-like flavin-dependent oxidoreductase (luciferase family)